MKCRPAVPAVLGALLVMGPVCANGTSLKNPLYETQPSGLLEGMPSFPQRNEAFYGGGRKFCGPTAASNALMWLADHGYPKLKPAAEDEPRAQTEMINRLAGLMGTYRDGTSVASFTNGIKSYLETVGYSCKSWVYSGNSCANRTLAPPDIKLVNTMSAGNTALWLSVGWYRFDASRMKYTRDRGHWVTLVGYGKNQHGEADPDCLLIADPESPNNHRYITLTMLDEGKLTDGRSRVDAKGYYNVVELSQRWGDSRDKYCILETIEAMTIQ